MLWGTAGHDSLANSGRVEHGTCSLWRATSKLQRMAMRTRHDDAIGGPHGRHVTHGHLSYNGARRRCIHWPRRVSCLVRLHWARLILDRFHAHVVLADVVVCAAHVQAIVCDQSRAAVLANSPTRLAHQVIIHAEAVALIVTVHVAFTCRALVQFHSTCSVDESGMRQCHLHHLPRRKALHTAVHVRAFAAQVTRGGAQARLPETISNAGSSVPTFSQTDWSRADVRLPRWAVWAIVMLPAIAAQSTGVTVNLSRRQAASTNTRSTRRYSALLQP